MFSGKAAHTVDAKGRVFVPSMYREELGSSFVVAKGFGEPYLIVYPMQEWQKLIEKIDALGMDKNTRNLKRYIMMNANPTEMDSQGRIVLSKEHRGYAHLEKDIIILGMSTTVEIWDAAAISAETAAEPEGFEDILSKL